MTSTSMELSAVHAVEILDSRGGPTLAVTVTLTDGTTARAEVPSGASTGSREAVELRDGDKARYGGKGVLTAVGNVNGELADTLVGRSFADPAAVDQAMRDLDGTRTRAGSARTASSASRSPPAGRTQPAPGCRCGGR